jgi:exopolysaccharide biosynthesis protein
LLRKSSYRHRFLFALIIALLYVSFGTYVMMSTFVFAQAEKPVAPTASLVFTPVATPTPVVLPTPVETVYTDTQYTDANIQINVTKVVKTNLVYYVADVKLNSLQYFKTAFANGTFGRNVREATSVQAKNNKAILAINGDYYGYRSTGVIIRGGTLYRDKADGESLVLFSDGSMRITGKSESGASLVAAGAVHSWSFGPTLVIDGAYADRDSKINTYNPRTGIGMIEPYHFVFIVVDGRLADSKGLQMKDFAQLFVDYGCKVAYNLDGGGTSTMIMHDKIVNRPCYGEERNISDIIYISLE